MQPFPGTSSSDPKLVWGVVCSSILHLLLISVLVGVPGFSSPKRTYFSSAYTVKLVDGPKAKPGKVTISKGGKGKAGKVTVEKKSKKKSKKTVSKKKSSKKKSASLSIKDKDRKGGSGKALKKKQKTKNTEGAFAFALDKIRKKVEEGRRREEVAKIRDRIAEESEEEGKGSEQATGSGGMLPGQGAVANLPLNYRLYYQVIEQKIKDNWNLALPRGVIEDMRGMEVILSITIRSDGEITKVSFEEKTGNVYLDDSAFRAVKKSSPLPSFSEYNIREPFFETGIIFPAGELL